MKYLQTLLLSFFLLPLFSLAQNTIQIEDYYQSTTAQLNYQDEKQVIKASDYKSYDFDLTSLKKDLVKAKHRSIDNFGEEVLIEIPNPDGGSEIYRVLANTTMSPGYQTKFEGIRTFDVIQKNKPSIHGKIDFTQHGFHAMIFNPAKGTFFIDPMYVGNDQVHMVYYRSNFITDKAMSCEFEGDPKYSDKPSLTNDKSFGTCELKTYRLAIAATGEYTTYHGGTVADAAAAQVTTMNRVNGVYERDMAITMEFIEDNDDIIYTNSATDPYTNGNPGLMISQNQTNLTTVIGSANYDIGHVFGTNSGGLASLESVCNSSSKARGVTGSSGPVGDAFDIDYVAHEMGHQFGCNHTFNNSCGGNRNNSTAMEPGSGSTIMAYAGICTPNVQNNSDDHFHGISLQEMGAFTVDDIPNCPATEVLVNVAPTIDSTTGDVFIPANTPFALTAYASDLDDDDLLYCWEQMDAEISQQAPVSTSEFGPNFRSNSPELSPTRYFPNLEDLSDGVSPTWEVLASVTRAFSFRVVVRDNAAGGGCNDHADLVVNTVGTAGPFVVNYPSDAGITWAGLSTQTVTWDLANTNLSPINCSNVDIFLSTDGGLTYPTQLADDAENDGAHAIQVPNTASTECRIMVMAKNGSFFDISDNDFEITSTSNTYTINTSETDQNVCQPNDAVYTIDIGSVDGYTDAVSLSVDGLPSGATAVFSDNNVSPPTTVTLTISGSDLIVSGGYDFQILGSSTSGSTILDLFFSVFDDVVDAVVLTYPFDEAIDITLAPTFTWEDAGFGATYDVEIATDISFTNIVQSYAGLGSTSVTVTPLESESTYYWRVNANNSCTDSPSSEVFTFTTAIVNCATFMSSDVPVSISSTSTPTVTSTLEISGIGEIIGITVVDLSGEHTWISDLTISLSSPQGTDVLLFSGICTNDDDWDLNFDDNASSSVIDCPPQQVEEHISLKVH